MLLTTIVVLAALGVALANGANDNFKGVATLLGSETAKYRRALIWATITTLCGSLASLVLATKLVDTFSGKGLVPDEVVAQPPYLAAVALGACATVLLATRVGLPISTTHALIGALLGAAMMRGAGINGAALLTKFLAPLLVSPVLALVATVLLHRCFRRVRLRLGIAEETCFCVGSEPRPVAIVQCLPNEMALVEAERLSATMDSEVVCRQRYGGQLAGIPASRLLDGLHYLSAGAVSFARGLNDTPKIAALLVAATALASQFGSAAVGLLMALGGILMARRVAETISHKITPMNAGQGFTANLVTSLIVIGASLLGRPVSTTHVSCGGIFGVGAVTGEARWQIVTSVVGAWILTLPLAALVAGGAYRLLALTG